MARNDFIELLLRCRAPQQPGGGYPLEAVLDGTGLWTGGMFKPDENRLNATARPAEYGRELWNQLVAGWSDVVELWAEAQGQGEGRVRLRVLLEDETAEVGKLKWELLQPSHKTVPAGVDLSSPVSRFMALRRPTSPPDEGPFRLLVVVANPRDLRPGGPLEPIDVVGEVRSLLEACRPLIHDGLMQVTVLPGQTGLLGADVSGAEGRVLPGPATVEAIGDALAGQHGLHFIGHGNFHQGQPLLVLEKVQGSVEVAVTEEVVTRWSPPGLRVVFLQSCQSDPRTVAFPDLGLGQRFIRQGVPVVVAMRDFVGMADARRFAHTFYRTLIECGEADVAGNAGRNAIYKTHTDSWAIPVVYSRLRAGDRVWRPDTWRQAYAQLATQLRETEEVKKRFPLEVSVVRDVWAVRREIEQPETARIDALAASKHEIREGGGKLLVLVGGRGRAKTSHLQSLFVNAMQEASSLEAPGVFPVLLAMKDLETARAPEVAIAVAAALSLRDHGFAVDAESLRGRLLSGKVLLLIDGDDEIGPGEFRSAIQSLESYLQHADGAACYLTLDDAAFQPEFFDASHTTALVMRDLRPETLKRYLEEIGLPRALRESLAGPLQDWAGVPWLLSRILALAEQKFPLRSRFRVVERVIHNQLEAITQPPGVVGAARAALEKMAWEMHTERRRGLSLERTYIILAEVRRQRDFPLDSFCAALHQQRLLVPYGRGEVRFAYRGLHSYFTACYLTKLPEEERERRIAEIVAGFGRLPEHDKWQEVLLLLPGLLPDSSGLLQALLETELAEGDQLVLASRIVHEARAVGSMVGEDLVERLAQALIRRSHPLSALRAKTRARMVEALGHVLGAVPAEQTGALRQPLPQSRAMAEGGDIERVTAAGSDAATMGAVETGILKHLFSLLTDKVRPLEANAQALDYSGIRLTVMSVLLRAQTRSAVFLQKRRVRYQQELLSLVRDWTNQNVDHLRQILGGPEPGVLGAAAVFALGTLGTEEAIQALVERFFREPAEDDLHWAIVDTMIELHAGAVAELVVQPAMASDARGALDPRLHRLIVYAIGRLGATTHVDQEAAYLKRQMQAPEVALSASALRSYAQIMALAGDREEARKLRETCHAILVGQYKQARNVIPGSWGQLPDAKARRRLAFYALDALHYVGTWHDSGDVLRKFYERHRSSSDQYLRDLSREVLEHLRSHGLQSDGKSGAAPH